MLKQWSLAKRETINSLENWRQNISYTLKLDHNFSMYLEEDGDEEGDTDFRLNDPGTCQKKYLISYAILGWFLHRGPMIVIFVTAY